MLGNVIILIVTWLLLRFEHKPLNHVLGLLPAKKALLYFGIGFVGTSLLAILTSYIFSVAANFSWVTTPGLSTSFLLKGFYEVLNSVLYEELVFRSYLLYLAIKFVGEHKANALSAVAFGVYHWFTFGVLGNVGMMVWVLFYTGVWGLMFAYAYSRTRSIALPVGLHLGWNLINQLVFSESQLSIFEPVTDFQTRLLSPTESMLYMHLPVLAFTFLVILLLTKLAPKYKID